MTDISILRFLLWSDYAADGSKIQILDVKSRSRHKKKLIKIDKGHLLRGLLKEELGTQKALLRHGGKVVADTVEAAAEILDHLAVNDILTHRFSLALPYKTK